MQRLFRVAGYAALLVTPVALLARSLLVSGVPVQTLGLGSGVVLVGSVAAVSEQRDIFDGVESRADRADIDTVVAVTVSASVTYLLSVHAGLGPVVAAALVGVVAGLGLPDLDTAAYCGSFVGMASPAVFTSVGPVALAGLIAGIAFVAASGTFTGFGGKLGTLALFGCLTAGFLTGVHSDVAPVPHWGDILLTVPVAVAGAISTGVLSVRWGLGDVLGSALVGLVAGLLLPVVLPGVGGRAATVAFCASFVGMSSTDRLEGVVDVGLAGALCGIVFVAVAPAFVGAGGKLGTTAFVSCVTLFGAGELRASRDTPAQRR